MVIVQKLLIAFWYMLLVKQWFSCRHSARDFVDVKDFSAFNIYR